MYCLNYKLTLIITSIVFVLIGNKQAFAQQKGAKSKISVGPALAFPRGGTAQNYKRGYGGSIVGEYHVVKNFNAVGSIGYLGFQYRNDVKARRENFGEETKINGVIPIKVGGKYYFGGIYYFDAEAGIAFNTGSNNANSFTYAPAAGVNIFFSAKYSMDVSLRYESWLKDEENLSFFGARLALAYSL